MFFIDDRQAPNAYAAPDYQTPQHLGAIYFGTSLLARELGKYGERAVVGIAAHEAAHIHIMFSRTMIPSQNTPPFTLMQGLRAGQPTAKRMELHADFMAGYSLAKWIGSSATENDLRGFAQSLYEKGDGQFFHPSHHGLPEERASFMWTGMSYALQQRQIAVAELAMLGFRHVVSQGPRQ